MRTRPRVMLTSSWSRTALLLAVIAGGACKKEGGAGTASPAARARSGAEADALWKLAPPGALGGLVVTPTGLGMLERATQDLRDAIAQVADLAAYRDLLEGAIVDTLKGPATSLAELGLDARKGFGMWVLPEGPVIAVPIGDRAVLDRRFRTGTDPGKLGDLTCTTHGAAYVCAESAAVLAKVGTGATPAAITRLGARGEIEGYVGAPVPLAAVAQLARGEITVRGRVGLVGPYATMFAGAARPRVAKDVTSGFAVLEPSAMLANVPDAPLPGGVTARAFARTIKGPLTIAIPSGSTTPDLRLPLADPGPMTTLVGACKELLPPTMLAPTQPAGACRFTIPQANLTLDAWVENSELRLGTKGATPTPARVALTPLGAELAAGTWALGFWGRGSMYGAGGFTGVPANLPGDVATMVRGLGLLSELGMASRVENGEMQFVLGVRTLFANPPELVSKLLAIPPADILSGKSTVPAEVARAFPDAPYAQDHAAGQGGLMIPTGIVGMLAAVAIPAFMDYQKKARVSQVQIDLNRLAKGARLYVAEAGALPVGTAGPVPATSCCAGPNARCVTTPADWQAPVWQALDFAVDGPSLFRYAIESDGKRLVAFAIGDLDCDGEEIAHTLEITLAADGTPQIQITPPRGVD